MKKVINSVAFIFLKDDKILVEKRKSSKRIDPNKICIPSGGIEKGETPEEALIRECKEELGISVKDYFFITSIIYKHIEVDFKLTYFVVAKWIEKIKKLEADKLLWIDKNSLEELDLEVDKKAIKKMNILIQKKELKSILLNYNIGKYLSHKHISQALENTVYFVKTTKGKYILKIFEDVKEKEILNQTRVQEYLSKKGNFVPKIVRDKKGRDIFYYKKKPIQIQEFVEGKRVKLSNSLIKQYGNVIGKIDSDLRKLKLKPFYPWGTEFEFKPMKIYSGKKLSLKKEHLKLLKEIKKLNKKKLSKSVVHGDLNLENTLVHKGKINAIIDFGDSHTGFTVTDPMIFICDEIITQKSLNYKKINLFLKEYEKQIKLSEEDKKALFLFAKLRCIYSMNWCNHMTKKHGKENKRIKNLFKEYYCKYELLSNTRTQDFLGNVFVIG